MKASNESGACKWTGVDLVDGVDKVERNQLLAASTLSTTSTKSTPSTNVATPGVHNLYIVCY
jgi:hypothetical protein